MDGLWLHHAPVPGAAAHAAPAWMDALATSGARISAGDLPQAPPDDARWLVVSNPVFTPELGQLARAMRDRGGGIAGAYETPDFDLGLWATGPLRGHPLAPQGDLLRHVRDLARSIALCDVLLATGPSMAARLGTRNPAARVLTLPPMSRAETAAAPVARRRRIIFAAQTPSDRVLLRGHETLLARAAELFGAELLVSEDAFLPEGLRDLPQLAALPDGADPGFGADDVLFVPPTGDGAWQRMLSGDRHLPALRAGAALWGAIPEQVSLAPSHRLLPLRVHWERDLRHHFTPGWRRAAQAAAERRWRRASAPEAMRAALVSALEPLMQGAVR